VPPLKARLDLAVAAPPSKIDDRTYGWRLSTDKGAEMFYGDEVYGERVLYLLVDGRLTMIEKPVFGSPQQYEVCRSTA
jgi:hypothetical protein